MAWKVWDFLGMGEREKKMDLFPKTRKNSFLNFKLLKCSDALIIDFKLTF